MGSKIGYDVKNAFLQMERNTWAFMKLLLNTDVFRYFRLKIFEEWDQANAGISQIRGA